MLLTCSTVRTACPVSIQQAHCKAGVKS